MHAIANAVYCRISSVYCATAGAALLAYLCFFDPAFRQAVLTHGVPAMPPGLYCQSTPRTGAIISMVPALQSPHYRGRLGTGHCLQHRAPLGFSWLALLLCKCCIIRSLSFAVYSGQQPLVEHGGVSAMCRHACISFAMSTNGGIDWIPTRGRLLIGWAKVKKGPGQVYQVANTVHVPCHWATISSHAYISCQR